MKKLTTLALAAMSLAPMASFATSWERTVTNADEFKEAFNAVGSGFKGDTYIINCEWDATERVSVSDIKPTMTAGKLIIRSKETDFDKMPRLQIAATFQNDSPNEVVGSRMSIIFENMALEGYKSYLLDHRHFLCADTIALRRCDIYDYARSILRFDGCEQTIDGEKVNVTPNMSIDVVEIKECRIHGTAQDSGNNWSVLRTFMPVNTLNITDNMFYDMPYTKGIWETRYPGNTAPTVRFANNLVLLGENKAMHPQGFTVLNAEGNLYDGAQIYLYNNIFAGPEKGDGILKNDTSFYTSTKITNAEGAVIYARRNIVDTKTYMSLADLDTYLMTLDRPSMILGGEAGTDPAEVDNYTLDSFTDFSWDTGKTFQDAANNLYYLLKANQWYSMGAVNEDNMVGATYIGPSIAYVDEFPTPAAVNVTIEGPSYISYTISPEKDVYYLDDEVTITLNPGTNNYLTNLNTFEGWSDGVKELSRTETLTGDLNLTAKFTDNRNVVSAFTLNGITKNADLASYSADVYLDMDPSFQSVVYAVTVDTTLATGTQDSPFHYHNGTLQARSEKFGEDPQELRMPILSRRTPAIAKGELRDMAVFAIPCKGITDLHVSCYVGSDNNAMGNQIMEYSNDSTTWTKVGELAPDNLLENLKWKKLEADLPNDGKDKVWVRVYGDVTSEPVCTPDEGIGMVIDGEINHEVYDVTDGFEYIGSILITGNTSKAVTGISEVTTDEQKFDENAPMYNIMGMKVAKGTKGLIIQNGKKYVVK